MGRKQNTGTVILLYHRIFSPLIDPQMLCVDPQTFSEHLRIIKEHATVVPLRDLEPRRRERGGGRKVAVTFDDGYADNLAEALPRLIDADVPATVFVTAGVVSSTTEFWWDALEHLFLEGEAAPDHLELTVGNVTLWIDLGSPAARERGYWALQLRMRELPSADISSVLHQITKLLDKSPVTCRSHDLLEEDGIRAMSESSLIDIGAHTMTHPMLASLDRGQQAAEIREPRGILQDITGKAVDSFSYPYGGAEAFTHETTALVESSGYRIACSNIPKKVSRGADPLCLPRFLVRNWEGTDFESRLLKWFDD